MASFEVMYKVFSISSSGIRESVGPSDYTTVVEAPSQYYASEMVKNMNGGSDHCQIMYTKQLN